MQLISSLKKLYAARREIWYAYRHQLPTIALITGFVWDNLTLGRPDHIFDNAVMLFYLVVAGIGIGLIARVHGRGEVAVWKLILIQFAFGNLLSGLFVLYSTSGTLAGNWVFFLFIAALLLGNELFRRRYAVVHFNLAIYYVALFMYVALVFPILLGTIGAFIFILSGIASLIIVFLLIGVLRLQAPRLFAQSKNRIIATIFGIFVFMNGMYFMNFIPPVPLALKNIEIFHHVERTDRETYRVTGEHREWYEIARRFRPVFQYRPGDSAYCFTAVFAPARLSAPIYHDWEYFNEETKEWESRSRFSFPISGGREEGYRGYTVKHDLEPGVWRCSVETERGTLVGREVFEVVRVDSVPRYTVEER